jgi:predicted nucleic acid-binding protein
VTLVVDAAPLVALADEREPRRDDILELLRLETGGLFIPAPVTAEIDYLFGRHFGAPARRAFLEDLAARRYESPGLGPEDYDVALELDRRYADLDLGLADLSVASLPKSSEPVACSLSMNATSAWYVRFKAAHSRFCQRTDSVEAERTSPRRVSEIPGRLTE